MANKRILILIPARYASTRLAKKPLCRLSGRYLSEWVWLRSQELKSLIHQYAEVHSYVVTDHEEVELALSEKGVDVVRVDDELESGSDRIYWAWKRFFPGEWDLIINLQGDEPLIRGNALKKLVDFHLGSSVDVVTGFRKRNDLEGFLDPNCVKIVGRKTPEALFPLYFSRASVPHCRDQKNYFKGEWFHHLGLYSYRPKTLEALFSLGPSELELCERLEQLRLMEAGKSFAAIEFAGELLGVDTPEDIERVEALLKKNGESS